MLLFKPRLEIILYEKKHNANMLSEKVLLHLTKIPKGKITTYGLLAKKFNTSPRAIGKIMNSNKHPDKYPCYKVIMSDGSLGGYGLGIEKKIKLLKKDNIKIKNNKVLNFDSVIYNQ